ncbi:MAG TPA: dihydroneopterin aldolase, partial [Alphaproteobacteria bacterium]|nr:dihydroneopterin aldolase [Alphaproteobacteria bacterium]
TESTDRLDSVVCYDDLIAAVRVVVDAEHVQLVETLAERIAEACFRDRRVITARVRVEKLDVYPDAESVGVEIERRRP